MTVQIECVTTVPLGGQWIALYIQGARSTPISPLTSEKTAKKAADQFSTQKNLQVLSAGVKIKTPIISLYNSGEFWVPIKIFEDHTVGMDVLAKQEEARNKAKKIAKKHGLFFWNSIEIQNKDHV